jgi:hypothetical protein
MLLFDDAGDEEGATKPDGNKKVKEKIKFEVEASNLASKIDEFVRSKEIIAQEFGGPAFFGSHRRAPKIVG